MSTLWAAIAAAQLSALCGGQLAAPPVEPVPERATRLGDDDEEADAKPAAVPKASSEWRAAGSPPRCRRRLPVLMPPLPLPADLALPASRPPKPDRFVTVDGKVHVGRVLREIDGGSSSRTRRVRATPSRWPR
jgi:hypothetical protein